MKYRLVFILLLFAISIFGQNSTRVRELERQRKAAIAEIEMTNQLLQQTKQSTQNSLNRLNLLSRQIVSRNQIVNLLSQEIGELNNQINVSRQEIEVLQKELKEKQANYGKSIRSIYRRKTSQDKLLFIFSADNFAQSFRRMRYLYEYAEWQKRQTNEIIEEQKLIETKQQVLGQRRTEKNQLLSVREDETRKLETQKANQKVEVKQLSKKQKELVAQLRKNQRRAEDLNRQIENQIAAEIAKAEAEAKAARERAEKLENDRAALAKSTGKAAPEKTVPVRQERLAETKGGYAMTREEKQLSDNFAENRGRLPYPVTGRHTIVGFFGEQQHQDLKYVKTNNSGIDIQTDPGANARAVFNGVVTRVFVVPGYNNSVIIRHGNFLTVYSNLSQVYVKAGDRVTTRQNIGRIYSDPEDGDATILNFQLWKERTKQNPQPWLY